MKHLSIVKFALAALVFVFTSQAQAQTTRSGYLEEGEITRYTIHLHHGDHLHVYAEGSTDALDIDLLVYCPDGILVSQDTAEDAEPQIDMTARENGQFTIVVKMADTFRGRTAKFHLEVETH